MSVMRTTQNTVGDRVFRNLQSSLSSLLSEQEKLSSGKQINRPSDSPSGMVSALRLRSGVQRNDQFIRNIGDGFGWLGLADTTLQSASTSMTRARDLLLQGMNGSAGPAERAAVAAELTVIRDGMTELANTRYLDRSIFAGNTGGAAFDATGNFIGDRGAVERNVAPGVRVTVNLSGDAVFGTGVNSTYQYLTDAINNLNSNPSALSGDLANFDTAMDRMEQGLAEVGARYRRLEVLKDRTDVTQINVKQSLSEVEDIDMARTILDVQLRENSYQAALSATARVIQPSLVDFLS